MKKVIGLRGWDILEEALLFAYPVVEKQTAAMYEWKEGGRRPELFVICKSGRLGGGGGGQTQIPAYLSRGRLGVGVGNYSSNIEGPRSGF